MQNISCGVKGLNSFDGSWPTGQCPGAHLQVLNILEAFQISGLPFSPCFVRNPAIGHSANCHRSELRDFLKKEKHQVYLTKPDAF